MPNGYLAERRRRRGLLTLSLAVAATTGGTALLAWAWPENALHLTVGAGHGRGLSQNGAFEKAAQGWTADRILANYYSGADLADIGATSVRVRIMEQDDETLDVVSDSVFYVAGRRVIPGQAAHLTPTASGADVTITQGCDGDTLWEGATDDPWAYPVTEGTARPAEEQLEICGGNAFRGVLGVALDGDAFRTVNEVDLDDYLKGVVPAEMIPGWADQGGTEALKAQAIAARSYALAENRYTYAQTCDTTDCQMYLGTDKEDPRTTEAVESTSGRVLVRDNHILRAEYSAAPDGGPLTPASAMEIGPALTDFPAVQSPGLLPSLLSPQSPQTDTTPTELDPETGAAPEITTPGAGTPTYTDPSYAQQTVPGAENPTTPSNVTPDTPARPNPGNRTRGVVPLPSPGSADPNSLHSDTRGLPDRTPPQPLAVPTVTPTPRAVATPTPSTPARPTYAVPQPTAPAVNHQSPE
ncbi:SpoIID/LytB domain-containing protein [Nocardia sp. NPDC059764]|uniref:SpoIID/LytB domain-containing protein n=1 Tax=Nocardia sp. NPDC059764 TaxID=3346939 RepID=UPI003667D55E